MGHNLEAQLATFRRSHRPLRGRFACADWSYFAGGAGPTQVLLLPGAPGIAEMAFPYVLALESHYRVIAPSYPAGIGALEQLLAGLDELLAAECGGPVALVGASYSGLVAQCLLARSPGLVASLLIGDTGVARPGRARAMAVAGALLTRLPPLALHGACFALLAAVLWGGTPAHRFWQRYFKGVVALLTADELANRLQVMVEMDRRGPGEQAMPLWRGPTLLMETRGDPLFSPRERAALRVRFPQAELHSFDSRGHITALTRAPEYIAVMLDFLARHSQVRGPG